MTEKIRARGNLQYHEYPPSPPGIKGVLRSSDNFDKFNILSILPDLLRTC